MTPQEMTFAEIVSRGCAALVRELGPVGYVRFMQQFVRGQGDYSKERHEWVDKLALDDIRAGIEAMRQPPNTR